MVGLLLFLCVYFWGEGTFVPVVSSERVIGCTYKGPQRTAVGCIPDGAVRHAVIYPAAHHMTSVFSV